MVDGRPHVVAAAMVFVVVAAVRHFGERADPMDEPAVGHATVPDDATGTCRQ